MQKKIKIILPLIILLTINCFAGSNVEHIFDLAKKSVCKDVATDILKNPLFTPTGRPTGKTGYFISQLNALTATPFPYRFEITNGYKEGFVYYALLGYLNEMNGKIPVAYRCYQNSLTCIDEDKSFSHPLPRAEFYLAIGRTCLAAGRYMDAKDWLDNAFLEAGDNLQLQAAIDRVLIRRANEIGDYPEVIFLYQHLEQLAGGQKTEDRGQKSKEKRTTDHGLPQHARGTRITGLTKSEIANYAQILFYSRKDREGFGKLLEGISKYGIDNNLGVKDPLVDKFLNNIMRADDDEVKYFYDLLGWAIVDARAKAGDEEYLAFLCNARTLFCKVYDFLNPEDDLKKVKKRIDDVKEQIANGNVFWSVIINPLTAKRKARNRKNPGIRGALRESTNRKIINGEMEKSPEIILDDLLMLADWKLKQKDYKNAGTNYYLASLIATGKFANLEYDGTTAQNAAKMGMIYINPQIQQSNNPIFDLDSSFRSAELTLKLYLSATNDEQRAEYDTEAAMTILPKANPFTLNYLDRIARSANNEKTISAIKNYIKRKPEYPNGYDIWSRYLLAEGDLTNAFNVLLNGLSYRISNNSRHTISHCRLILPYATQKDLIKFSKVWPEMEIFPILSGDVNLKHSIQGLMKARDLINSELEMRIAFKNEQYKKVINILNKKLNVGVIGHGIIKAKTLLALGQTNETFNVAWKSYESRIFFANKDNASFPPVEIQIIKNAITENTPQYRIKQYMRWLNTKIEDYKKNNKYSDANNALAEYNRVIKLIKKEQK